MLKKIVMKTHIVELGFPRLDNEQSVNKTHAKEENVHTQMSGIPKYPSISNLSSIMAFQIWKNILQNLGLNSS